MVITNFAFCVCVCKATGLKTLRKRIKTQKLILYKSLGNNRNIVTYKVIIIFKHISIRIIDNLKSYHVLNISKCLHIFT